MRRLAFSTIFLATAFVLVAPGCTKSATDAAATDANKGEAAANDAKKAGDAGEQNKDKPADSPAPPAEAAPPAELAPSAGVALIANPPTGALAASLALVPDQAEFVIGLSPKLITASPFYALVATEMAQDPQFQAALSSFKECDIDPAKFESVVLGFSQEEEFVAVVNGESIGQEAKASCVIASMQKQAGDTQAATVAEQGGLKSIQFTDGRAYLVNEQTLAITTTNWDATVAGLIGGQGSSVMAGKQSQLFAKVNTQAGMWGVAEVPAQYAAMAGAAGMPPEFSSLQGAAGSIDLTSGAVVTVLGSFDSPDKATAVATQLQAMVSAMGPQMPAELAGVAKSVKIEAKGADLMLAMSASMADIKAIQSAAPR